MNKHVCYLRYVLLHKWYVLTYGLSMVGDLRGVWNKIHFLWRCAVHDLSKFYPSEWFAYVDMFYGGRGQSPEQTRAFNLAWLLHQRRNKHHHQYWLLRNDDGSQWVLPIPPVYVAEMVADWRSASTIATGADNALRWFMENRRVIALEKTTLAEVRWWLEKRPCATCGCTPQ